MARVSGYSGADIEVLVLDLTDTLDESFKRVLSKVVDSLPGNAVTAAGADITAADSTALFWQEELNGVITPYIADVYTGSAVQVAVGLADAFPVEELSGVPLVANDFVVDYMKTAKNRLVGVGDELWFEIRAELVTGVQEGWSTQRLADRIMALSGFTHHRSTVISRTEIHAAAEGGSFAQMKFVGYTSEDTKKVWLATNDLRTRDTHAHVDNVKVDLDERFRVGRGHLLYPGDPGGPPEEIIQCRCSLEYDVEKEPVYRCSTFETTTSAAESCVLPVSDIELPELTAEQMQTIFDIFKSMKVAPSATPAKIHKALLATRVEMADKLPDLPEMSDIQILSLADELGTPHPKAKHTYVSKYEPWSKSPAGKKAISKAELELPATPPAEVTHVVTPIEPDLAPDVALPKLSTLPDVAPAPKASELSYTGKTLGSHGAQVWTDGTGKRWLFKPQQDFLTDLDVGIARLQSKALATRPGIYKIELNGQKGSIQYMFDSAEAFPNGSFDPLKLSAEDLLTMQREQIFDWMISNFDTHSGQWIRLADGTLFETDKGQAFKFFGKDKLSWDYVPVTPLGQDKLTYNQLWKAYVSGKDIPLQDPISGDLGIYLEQLMAIDDDVLKDLLRPYAKQIKGDKAEEFLSAVVLRKNALKGDFAKFWEDAQLERAKHLGTVPAPVAPAPTPAPVVSPASVLPSEAEKTLANGAYVSETELYAKLGKYGEGDIVAYAKTETDALVKVVKAGDDKVATYIQKADGTWIPVYEAEASNVGELRDFYEITQWATTPTKQVSPIPGKGPNDLVSIDEIIDAANLWKADQLIAVGEQPAFSITVEIYSDGKGGFKLKNIFADGTVTEGPFDPALISSFKATFPELKLAGDSYTPSPFGVPKPSPLSGVSSGTVIDPANTLHLASNPGVVAYALDDAAVYRIRYTGKGFDVYKRSLDSGSPWSMTHSDLQQLDFEFDDSLKSLKWYASDKTGAMPDVVNTALGNPVPGVSLATPPTAPITLPSKSLPGAGKSHFGMDIPEGGSVNTGTIFKEWDNYPNGYVLAIGDDPFMGETFRLISAEGHLVLQKRTSAGAWKTKQLITSEHQIPAFAKWVAHTEKLPKTTQTAVKKFVDKLISPPTAPVTPAAVSTATADALGAAADISSWTQTQKAELFSKIKSKGVYTSSNNKVIWNALQSVRSSAKSEYGDISALQLLRILDEQGALKAGVKNEQLFEKKLVSWLTTPEGRAYVNKRIDAPIAARDVTPARDAFELNPNPDAQDYRTINKDDAVTMRAEQHAQFGGWTSSEKAALKDYTGGVYTEWNEKIRDGDLGRYKDKINAAQRGMRPSTRSVLLHRGTSFLELNDPGISDYESLLPHVGKTYVNRGFNSTSIGGRAAFGSSPLLIEIEAPAGTPMAYVADISHFPRENEMLLPTHLVYKVLSVSKKDHQTTMRVRVVGVWKP